MSNSDDEQALVKAGTSTDSSTDAVIGVRYIN